MKLYPARFDVHTCAGDLEYCTLLGHRLYVDLHVYFAALRVLAHYLAGAYLTVYLSIRLTYLMFVRSVNMLRNNGVYV